MREIKLRAWDKEGKELLQGVPVKGGFRALEKGELTFSQILDEYNADRFEVMQFTGLKDKNGKEIYEGNVFSALNGNWQVKFGEWLLYIAKEHALVKMYGFYCERREEGRSHQLSPIPEEMEVIGNIYENPEFL